MDTPTKNYQLSSKKTTIVNPEGTRCEGTAIQNHPSPLSFCLTTCTSVRVEKMREGGGGREIQWIHANGVGESMSDTCAYKNVAHLLRL